jgi:predicted metal-dependent HD superfamily phosphohydrolase
MDPSYRAPGSRWPLTDSHDLRDRLSAAYADPARGYHNTAHLEEVLDRLENLAESGAWFDRPVVTLAAWFHDAVYDGERDAEERSAMLAEELLAGRLSDEEVAEVARLVRMTESHSPEPSDLNGCALSDADLAILAAPVDRYDRYVAAVRAEYAHLDDDEFAAGRRIVLQGLADREHLFHTAYARAVWESPARANLARELSRG